MERIREKGVTGVREGFYPLVGGWVGGDQGGGIHGGALRAKHGTISG